MKSTSSHPQIPDRHYAFTNKGVVIIGAGFGGLLQAIDLLKRGVTNFVILEKASNVGGTWLQNQYPGCACDVLSNLYSVSTEPNPDWSQEYPGQEELLRYIISIASKHNLYQYVRFNSSVSAITFDDATGQWHSEIHAGGESAEYHEIYTIKSDFLVSAIGQLNQPSYPAIKGIDRFRGKLMHSARWDWSYNLSGKRVAMIGSGATAVQILPEIAAEVSHITCYSRTPNWIISRLDSAVPDWKKAMFRWFPVVQRRIRALQMNYREWTFGFIRQEPDVVDAIRSTAQTMLQQTFPDDPSMREKLTPTYAPGCKRVLVTDDYLPAFKMPHVRLETDEILEIDERGIISSRSKDAPESHDDVDLIILATGFQTNNFMHSIRVTGRNGRSLSEIWSSGAEALHGVTVHDLPNFGIVYGPNTNLGHSSILIMEEAQVKYIGTLAEAVLDARQTARTADTAMKRPTAVQPPPLSLTPKATVMARYNKQLQEALGGTAFADPGCKSWYKDPRSGKIVNCWSDRVIPYQKALERVVWDDYEGGDIVARQRRQKEQFNPRVIEETVLSNGALFSMGIAGLAGAGTLMHYLHRRGFGGLLTA